MFWGGLVRCIFTYLSKTRDVLSETFVKLPLCATLCPCRSTSLIFHQSTLNNVQPDRAGEATAPIVFPVVALSAHASLCFPGPCATTIENLLNGHIRASPLPTISNRESPTQTGTDRMTFSSVRTCAEAGRYRPGSGFGGR